MPATPLLSTTAGLSAPFNTLLRAPDVAVRQLDEAEAISTSDLNSAVREIAILTVAARWRAECILQPIARPRLAPV